MFRKIYSGNIDNGTFEFFPKHEIEFLNDNKLRPKGQYDVWIEKQYPKHSKEQRGYLHAVVLPMLAQDIYTRDDNQAVQDAKEDMKKLFVAIPRPELIAKMIEHNNQSMHAVNALELENALYEIPEREWVLKYGIPTRETRHFNTLQYGQFTEKVIRFATLERKLIIPEPERVKVRRYV